MSKHIGLMTKVDNTGTKWYRRVVNVGDTSISAGNLVEVAYDSHSTNALNLTATPGVSVDYNLGRLVSGANAEMSYTDPIGRILGVAIDRIPQRGLNAYDQRYYSGWVQYRGAAQVSTREAITANTIAVPASSNGTDTGHGCVMMAARTQQGMSAGVGLVLSSAGATAANNWTWVYLWL